MSGKNSQMFRQNIRTNGVIRRRGGVRVTLDQKGHERQHWWLEFPYGDPVRPVVPRGVHKQLVLRKHLPELVRELLPRQGESRHRLVAQTHHYREESVEVLVFLTAGRERLSAGVGPGMGGGALLRLTTRLA